MKGQKLFVRKVVDEDQEAVALFSELHLLHRRKTPEAYLAKIVGELVALAETEPSEDTLILHSLFVLPALRELHVGRKFLKEALRDSGLRSMTAAGSHPLASYLEKIGFIREGDTLRMLQQQR